MSLSAEPASALSAARTHLAAGRLAEAAALVRPVLVAAPGDVEALQLMGGIAAAAERWDEAVDWLGLAVEEAPEREDARGALGAAMASALAAAERHRQGGRAREVLALCRIVLRHAPGNAAARALYDAARRALDGGGAAADPQWAAPRRIKIVIPHFVASVQSMAGEEARKYQSLKNPEERAAALRRCILSLKANFGGDHYAVLMGRERCYRELAAPDQIDIAVYTLDRNHVVDLVDLPRSAFRHVVVECDPLKLGIVAQEGLKESGYDYYCYTEDDIAVHDPSFFQKLQWFTSIYGPAWVLQPNRYEIDRRGRVWKTYVDGGMVPVERTGTATLPGAEVLAQDVLGRRVVFEEPLNRHSGCFFLNRLQRDHYMAVNHDLDRQPYYVGPLETAATLGVMRAFRVLKATGASKDFLEVEHVGARFGHFVNAWERF